MKKEKIHINIVITVSLLLNVVLISKVLSYKDFIYEDLNRSIGVINGNLTSAQEILDEIILAEKIDESQYKDIYFMFEDFEHEYKRNLYRYYYELESKNKDFSDINLLFDMNDYILNFGKEKHLSLFKTKKDNIKIIDLSEIEVVHFKEIRSKNRKYINVIENYKADRNMGYRQNWDKIVDGIYENGIHYAGETHNVEVISSEVAKEYYFEPNVSIIEGTLITRLHYGPPGYGEDPDNDEQEYPFILQLEDPINVIAEEDDIMNSNICGVSEVQLVLKGKPYVDMAKQYKNKHIKVQGTLFSSM